MMNSWPALKPCHNKRFKSEKKDYLSELPNETLLSIVSSLTIKEAARLSVVSHKWEFIWRCFPLLNFEDSRAMQKISTCWESVSVERPSFVGWVDRVLEQHSGEVIDQLKITFDLDKDWQSHVDSWAAFAIDKQVKRLELDFDSRWRHGYDITGKRICGEPLDLPPKLTTNKSSIRSLSLKYVNATDEFIDRLPRSCPLLESLCIVGSKSLTKVSGSFQVKHLEFSACHNLKAVDISAPKLRSFVYHNPTAEQLHIAHASSLAEVSIGAFGFSCNIARLFPFVSKYFSQLLYLKLKMTVRDTSWGSEPRKLNLEIDNPPALPNLQHLELLVYPDEADNSLRGWTSLLAASPNLQKLTLKLRGCYPEDDESTEVFDAWPRLHLKCLKTLELVGYVGQKIDLELAFFVFENACMLEEVIIDLLKPGSYVFRNGGGERERLVLLQTKLPQGVKLIIK